MISLNTVIYGYNRPMLIKRVSCKGNDISNLLKQGDNYLNENKYNEALSVFTRANGLAPDDITVYKKLGYTYFHLKDYKKSEENYQKYLQQAPNDSECYIKLGEAQMQSGLYQKAIASFERSAQLDNTNDLAKRRMMEAKNYMLSIYSPAQAQKEKAEYANKNLSKALEMTVKYLTPEFMKDLGNVQIKFGETASMGGTPNIAQYENHNNTITVSKEYIYAAPQVIAAYLAHESIHAKDSDPYTSVYEEQDAYEVAAKFWLENSNGIKDPEMDYAADLYKKSPSTLRKRVEEIYTLRDPSINKTSPNHPPQKSSHIGIIRNHAASQSIKKYDVIA